MREEHEEGDGWLSPEQEAILDRVAAEVAAERDKLPADVRAARSEELRRRCEAARRYRLEQEAASRERGELPGGNDAIVSPGPQP
jgi:hypothetical protein